MLIHCSERFGAGNSKRLLGISLLVRLGIVICGKLRGQAAVSTPASHVVSTAIVVIHVYY
jgi:hypothetical protein